MELFDFNKKGVAMRKTSSSSVVCLLSSRLAPRVSRPLLSVALALGLSPAAFARYQPPSPTTITSSDNGKTLNSGTYKVSGTVTIKKQLVIADNAEVDIYFYGDNAKLVCDGGDKGTGKAGIKLPSSAMLTFRSAGGSNQSVEATGAAGGDGECGKAGANATSTKGGSGGAGGNGATAPGAGIGGDGGGGGTGGAGSATGKNASNGTNGSAGGSCGKLWVFDNIKVTAKAGKVGAGGDRAWKAAKYSYHGGGGGGGGGGRGGESSGIGGGGGGGAGGGGGSGSYYSGGGGGGGGGYVSAGGYAGIDGDGHNKGRDGNGSGGKTGGTCDDKKPDSAGWCGTKCHGGSGGDAGDSGSGGYVYAYDGKAFSLSASVGSDSSFSYDKTVFDMAGEPTHPDSDHDTYMLRNGTHIFNGYPVQPPVGLKRRFLGYYTAEIGGDQVFDANGKLVNDSKGQATLYAQWDDGLSDLCVNGYKATLSNIGTYVKGASFKDGTLTLQHHAENSTFELTGKYSDTSLTKILVQGEVNLKLNGISVYRHATTPSFLVFDSSANVQMTLVGDNELAVNDDSGNTYPYAVEVQSGAQVTVKGNSGAAKLKGERSGAASGILLKGSLTWESGVLTDYTPWWNNNGPDGGALRIEGGSFTMTGGQITGNIARNGAGIYLNSGSCQIEGGEISKNEAKSHGGGIAMNDGSCTLRDGKISGNTAEWGGGVHLGGTNGGIFTMTGGEIVENTATRDGGGIEATKGSASVSGGKISNNSASWGGAIYSRYGNTKVTVTGGWFEQNAASTEGSVAFTWQSGEILICGGVYVNNSGAGKEFSRSGGPLAVNGALLDSWSFSSGVTCPSIAQLPILSAGSTGTKWYVVGTGLDVDSCGLTEGTLPFDPLEEPYSKATVVLPGDGYTYSNTTTGVEFVPSPHQHDDKQCWTPVGFLPTSRPGHFVLTNDLELTETWQVPNGETWLCLNGHSIRPKGGAQFRLAEVTNKLHLVDCQKGHPGRISGGHADKGGAFYVRKGGALEIRDVILADNRATVDGGAVYLEDSADLTVVSGVFTNNTADACGGVIKSKGGNLTVQGGTFVANGARQDGGAIDAEADVTISGAQFLRNAAARGGVLYQTSKSATILGGTFTGNSASEKGPVVCVGVSSAGLVVRDGVFRDNAPGDMDLFARNKDSTPAAVTGGAYDTDKVGCLAPNFAPQPLTYTSEPTWNVIAVTGTLSCNDDPVTGGISSGRFAFVPTQECYQVANVHLATNRAMAVDEEGFWTVYETSHEHCLCGTAGGTEVGHDPARGWTKTGMLPKTAGFYYLVNDVVLTDNWTAPNGAFLCLNGHKIVCSDKYRCEVSGTLTITDCSENQTGTVTGGSNAGADGGAFIVRPGGHLQLYRGQISGNSAQSGGAVWVVEGGRLTTYGGLMTGNTVNGYGGAVYNQGAFTMYGGTISRCTTTSNGGAVYNGGTFTMNGGTLDGNSAYDGGAVYNVGMFAMYGGTAVDNRAADWGGFCFCRINYHADIYGGYFSGNSAPPGCCNLYHGNWGEKNGSLYGGVFAADPTSYDESLDSLVLTNDAAVTKVGSHYVVGKDVMQAEGYLAGGTYTFNPLSEEYRDGGLNVAPLAAVVTEPTDPVQYTLTISSTLVINGSFEAAPNLPAVSGEAAFTNAAPYFWAAANGVTLYGRESAKGRAIGTANKDYAAELERSGAVEQTFEVSTPGIYLLSFAFRGTTDATLRVKAGRVGAVLEKTIVPYVDGWCRARFEVTLLTGSNYLRFENVSTGERPLAVDDISLVYSNSAAEAIARGRVANGGFESGVPLPPLDGAAKLQPNGPVGETGWTAADGETVVYGRAATNDYPMGVSVGDYALYLPPSSSVSQPVICPGSADEFCLRGATGRLYAVSFDCATATPGKSPKVEVLLNGTAVAWTHAPTNGAWTALSTLVFVPNGENTLSVACRETAMGAVVDNVSFVPYVRPDGELVSNAAFVFGNNLPAKNGVAYVGGTPPVEPARWDVTGEAGIFDSQSTEMTRAGTRTGAYALFLANGARAVQTFAVQTEGEYRVSCLYAARRAASGGARPVLTVKIDGVVVREVSPSSCTAYDAVAALLTLKRGDHEIALEVTAPPGQAAVVDCASVRLPRYELSLADVTGLVPAVRIKPVAASHRLVSRGVEPLTAAGGDAGEDSADTFAEEDFEPGEQQGTVVRDDFFLLEAQAGVYAHPEYRSDETIICRDGFAFSVGGVPRSAEGTILACSLYGAGNGKRHVISLQNAAGGKGVVLAHTTDGQTTNLFSVSTANMGEAGEIVHYAASLDEGYFSLFVNGRPMGSCACPDAFEALFDGLRLGEMPESLVGANLPARQCGSFALSDVRFYNQGLTGDQVADLAASVGGRVVTVTYYDEAENRVVRTVEQRVGAVYGVPAELKPVRPGYAFTGWTLGGTGVGDFVTAATPANTMTDHRLYANWSRLGYTVTYDFRGYPFAENRTSEILSGEVYDLPTGFEIEGVPFRGWTNAYGRVVTPDSTFPSTDVYADETLYADFDAVKATLTFEPANGEAATALLVEIGTPILPLAPDVSRKGYGFCGWWSAAGGRLTEETGLSDYRGETWTARWIGDEQTVTWYAYGCIGDGVQTVSRTGDPLLLPEELPIRTNDVDSVRFYGWASYDNIGTTRVEIARWDHKTGEWIVNEDFVTPVEPGFRAQALWWQGAALDTDGGALEEAYAYLYPGRAYGDYEPLPTPAREGYAFTGWHVGTAEGELVRDDTVVPADVPTVLVATWSPRNVNVTLDPNGGSNVIETVTVRYLGPYGELPAPIRPGYALAYWNYVHEGGPVIRPETIVSNCYDHLVVASWTNAWYEMAYELNGKVLVGRGFSQRYESPWPALYVPTEADLSSAGVGAKDFRGWALGTTGEAVREGEIALVTAPGRLVAVLENMVSTLSLDPNGGALDPTYRTVAVKMNEPIEGLREDVQRPGCAFLGWYTVGDGVGPITNGTVWTRLGTTQLVARWRGTRKLTFVFDAGAGGVQETNGYYLAEMPVPPVPVRADGARFLGWWCGDVQCYGEDGRPVADLATCPYESDQTFVARWEATRDFFAGAYELESGVPVAVTGLEATEEPDEPAHDREGVLRATHWYAFAGTRGTSVTVVFEDFSGEPWPAAAVAVYRGTSLADLTGVAAHEEYDDFTLTFDFTLPADGTYYLAVAQDGGSSALADYELTVTGTLPPFTSQWTDPESMPGATPQIRNAMALKADGFSDDIAARVAPTNTYAQFTAWAGVGKEGEEIPPDALNTQPNVVLASAYNFYSSPSGSVRIVSCEATTNAAGTVSMKLTLRAYGDFTAGGASSIPLLKAAVGVIGSTAPGGTFSADDFDCKVRAVDLDLNEVRLLVTPKPTGSATPTQFFFKGVTY